MQNAQSEGYIDYTRPSGAAYDATMVKGKMVITPNKPYEPYGAAPAKKKVTKLPMSQAAGALAAEAITYGNSYPGLGTDVVDKKKKLNPQPNLMMKPKQVKDFTDKTYKGYSEELEEITEGKMKEIYTDMQDHATKKGYSSHKQFTPADYDAVGKQHGISGKELAVIAGHKTAAQVTKEEITENIHAASKELSDYAEKHGGMDKKDFHSAAKHMASGDHGALKQHIKSLDSEPRDKILTVLHKHGNDIKRYGYSMHEENLDELKASTLQSYADKAHQQALDATYDAAHLNRTGEEKFKAAAKRLASKRAGGVQMAQTKLDKMAEALELPHSIGDTVRCTRTQRLATVAGFDNDQYTVVYGDGSTETGPANYWTTVHKVNNGDSHGGA
jgi:hypothetical protein